MRVVILVDRGQQYSYILNSRSELKALHNTACPRRGINEKPRIKQNSIKINNSVLQA